MKNLIEPQPKYLALSLPLNPFSLGHSGVGLLAALLIAGCAGVAASGFDKSNTVGRDVDEVIAEMKAKGLNCTAKFEAKQAVTNKSIGSTVCYSKEKSPFCPDIYTVSMGFDLSTNTVTSFGKDKRTNCF